MYIFLAHSAIIYRLTYAAQFSFCPSPIPPSRPWYHSYLNFRTVNFISIFISAYIFKFNFRIQEEMLMIVDISGLYVVQIS